MANDLADKIRQSVGEQRPPPQSQCSYLFHQGGSNRAGDQVELHTHPFWQLEAVISGRVSITVEDRAILLRPGGGLLIPTGRPHRLSYLDDCRYLSIKFATNAAGRVEDLSGNADFTAIAAVLHRLLPKGGEPTPVRKAAVGHTLAALVALFSEARTLASADPLVARLAEMVDRGQGQVLTIELLAKRIGLSPSHLSARFRQSTGQSLKHWLDRRRAETAANLLAYSEQNLTGIAETLAFPDLFAFSRFFKRVSGQSPRQFRQSLATPRSG